MAGTGDKEFGGVITPRTGEGLLEARRYEPAAELADQVAWYEVATWSLPPGHEHGQSALAHPVVMLTVDPDRASITGVRTQVWIRQLHGGGRAVSAVFRPAGFRPWLGRAMHTITDRVLDIEVVFGTSGRRMAERLRGSADTDGLHELGQFLHARLPVPPGPSVETTGLAERAINDPTIHRVDELAAATGWSVRHLERRFREDVGVSPKAVILRARIYRALELLRQGHEVDWAALAANLGYADQPHFTRDFTATIGMNPTACARSCLGRIPASASPGAYRAEPRGPGAP